MSRLLLISTCLSLIVLAVFLSRLFEPGHCINSSIVQSVVILRNGKAHKLLRCEWFGERVSTQDEYAKIIDAVNWVSQRIDRAGIFSNPSFQLSLFIDYTEPFLWHRGEHVLQVGSEWALSPQLLGAAITRSLVYRSHGLKGPPDFGSEVESDFIWSVVSGQEYSFSTENFFGFEPPVPAWEAKDQSWQAYCEQGPLVPEHWSLCKDGDDLFVTRPLHVWPLKSLSNKSLWLLYETLSLAERWDLQSFLRGSMHSKDGEAGSNIEAVGVSMDQEKIVEGQIQRLLPPSLRSRGLELVHHLIIDSRRIDLLAYVADDFYSVRKSAAPNDLHLLIRKISETSIDDVADTEVKTPKHIAVLSCGEPTIQLLNQLRTRMRRYFKADRFTFVRVCGDVPEEILVALSLGGAPFLAQQSPETEFVEFHLASLELALDFQKSKANKALESWPQIFRWMDLLPINSAGLYRPRAVFSGIMLFRDQDLLNKFSKSKL